MASLLSLRPSRTIEEKQTQVRKKILKTPVLASSSGISKDKIEFRRTHLTRCSLGIAIKKYKLDDEVSKEDAGAEINKGEINLKDEVDNNKDSKEDDATIINKDEINFKDGTDEKCKKDIKIKTDSEVQNSNSLSLLGDYGSSDDNSDSNQSN